MAELRMNYDYANESRAEAGLEAVRVGSFYFPDDMYTAVGDALANILHLCDRYGISKDQVIQHAWFHYHGDHEDGEPTERNPELTPETDSGFQRP